MATVRQPCLSLRCRHQQPSFTQAQGTLCAYVRSGFVSGVSSYSRTEVSLSIKISDEEPRHREVH